jgi:hypothetical protein
MLSFHNGTVEFKELVRGVLRCLDLAEWNRR